MTGRLRVFLMWCFGLDDRAVLLLLLQVFDFHHQKFCPGTLSEKEGVHAAARTWPPGIRPVVHWSESQEGRKPHAHSDYVSVRQPFSGFLYSDFQWHPVPHQ